MIWAPHWAEKDALTPPESTGHIETRRPGAPLVRPALVSAGVAIGHSPSLASN